MRTLLAFAIIASLTGTARAAAPCVEAQTCKAACASGDDTACLRFADVFVALDKDEQQPDELELLVRACGRGNKDLCAAAGAMGCQWDFHSDRCATTYGKLLVDACQAGSHRACEGLRVATTNYTSLRRQLALTGTEWAFLVENRARPGASAEDACKGGDVVVCHRIGWGGKDAELRKRAVTLLDKACKRGDAIGCDLASTLADDAAARVLRARACELGFKADCAPKQPPPITTCANAASCLTSCQSGDAEACFRLGHHFTSYAYDKVPEPAHLAAMEKSCAAGAHDVCAMREGIRCPSPADRPCTEVELEQSRVRLTADCEAGSAEGCRTLSNFMSRSTKLEPNPKADEVWRRAHELYAMECERGKARSCFSLALGELGEGRWSARVARAALMLDLDCQRGDPRACDDLLFFRPRR